MIDKPDEMAPERPDGHAGSGKVIILELPALSRLPPAEWFEDDDEAIFEAERSRQYRRHGS